MLYFKNLLLFLLLVSFADAQTIEKQWENSPEYKEYLKAFEDGDVQRAMKIKRASVDAITEVVLEEYLANILLSPQELYFDKATKIYISDEVNQPKLSWSEGKRYCEDLVLGGYDDWYLPSISQMVSFEDRSNLQSFLVKELHHTKRYDYWSATEDAMVKEYAWSQGLMYKAYNHTHNKKDLKYIRCVREDTKSQEKNYYVKYKDVVVDKKRNLMWQDTKPMALNFDEAKKYCADLELDGFSEWELPDIKTLRSLVAYDKYAPAIDDTFTHTQNESYYSSSRDFRESKEHYVDVIEFNNGIDGHIGVEQKQYVRCVQKIKPATKKGKIKVFFPYDEGVLYIDGKRWGKLHSIMDDFQGTDVISLPFGIYNLEVKRVSVDGKFEVSGQRIIKVNEEKLRYVKVLATKKDRL